MTRRVSLYFEPYAWDRLNRFLSLLLLTGKPLYDLPAMNDLIEGIIVYVANLHNDNEISSQNLLPFMQQGFLPYSSKGKFNNQSHKGRIAFNVTDRTEEAIKIMREKSNKNAKEKIDKDFLENVSDPILIRACVYYMIDYGFDKFDINLYFSFLFGLRPYILSISRSKFDQELQYLTESEQANLRKIIWDDREIKSISALLSIYEERGKKNGDIGQLSPNQINDTTYQSNGFDFNYFSAFIGFVALRNSRLYDYFVPRLLIDFMVISEDIMLFKIGLEFFLQISYDFKRWEINSGKSGITVTNKSELSDNRLKLFELTDEQKKRVVVEIDKGANIESIAKLLNTTPQEVMELYKSVNGKYPNESTDREIKKKQLKW